MTGALQGKVAIVTGSGRGIGRGIAVEFAKEGARVIVASRSRGSVDNTCAEIEALGGVAFGVTCDVGNADDIKRTVAAAVERFGGIDILVNNAQSFGTPEAPEGSCGTMPLEDYRDAEWDYTFRTGPTASFLFMKAAFPYLKASGHGRIINFGSSYGQMGYPGTVAYNAAKEAIRSLTRTAANEWGQYGITCNVISPAVETDAFRDYVAAHPEFIPQELPKIPMRRFGDPYKDAGRIAVFIAGPDASFLTGMTFMVDGGFFMYP